MRYAIPAKATEKGYGYKRNAEVEADIENITLHRGKYKTYGSRRYFYGSSTTVYARCNSRTILTNGNFAFTADKDWFPGADITPEQYALMFFEGQQIPMWAFKAKPCPKCFKNEVTEAHVCSCGHTHRKMKHV